jgi:hypothetical protein
MNHSIQQPGIEIAANRRMPLGHTGNDAARTSTQSRASARIEEVSEALGDKEILRGQELITLRIRQRTKNT